MEYLVCYHQMFRWKKRNNNQMRKFPGFYRHSLFEIVFHFLKVLFSNSV